MRMINRAMKAGLIFFIVCFIAWLSLGTQALQGKYVNIEIVFLFFFCLTAVFYRADKRFVFSREDIFFCLYLILVTIGIFSCKDKQRAIAVYKAFVPVLGLVYFAGKNIAFKDLKMLRYIIFTIAACVFIVSIMGFPEILFKKSAVFFLKDNPFHKIHPIGDRMISTLMHPSVLGSYFVITLPACLFIIDEGKKRIMRAIGLFIFILGASALFFTFSRGAWLSVMISFFIYYWNRRRKLLFFLLACFIIVFCIFFLMSDQNSFIRNTFTLKGIKEGAIAESRINYVPVMRRMVQGHELFGVGLDHYRILFDSYSTEKVADIFRIPDNMYFTILIETGIMAFLSYVFFCVMVLCRSFVFINKTKSREEKSIMLTLVTGLIGFMIKMSTYDAFYWFAPLGFFGLYMGLCSGLSLRESRSQGMSQAD